MYDDRLEVTSPGMFLNNVTIEKMMEGYSKPRNPAIARVFAYMKIIEKWGTGIPRIFRKCKEYGLPDPQVVDFDGDVRVNMYRKVELYDHEKVNDRVNEKTVLSLLMENPGYTVTQMSETLKVSRKTVANRLKTLKEEKTIERVGSSRKSYWKINS